MDSLLLTLAPDVNFTILHDHTKCSEAPTVKYYQIKEFNISGFHFHKHMVTGHRHVAGYFPFVPKDNLLALANDVAKVTGPPTFDHITIIQRTTSRVFTP